MTKFLLTLLIAGLAGLAPAGGLAIGGGSVTVSPDPVTLGSTFTLEACGLPVPTSVSFEVNGPRKADPPIHYFTAGEPSTAPCFEDEWLAWWGVEGAYQITAWWRDSKGATHKLAVAKFTVVP